MIFQKNNISSWILSVLFCSLILFPVVIKFEHLFENHHHVSCAENSTHLHELTFDCTLDAFSFSFFNFGLNTFHFSEEILPSSKRIYHYQEHHIILDKRFVKLRGPPEDYYL